MSEKHWTQQEHETVEEATALWELLKVVRSGGSITITGSGPLCPASPRFVTRVQSHTGARYFGGSGETLAECLTQAVTAWGKL